MDHFPEILYDFYRITIQRLGRDLKIPFRLKKDRRIDDTPLHEALREVLINTIIHADYSGRVPLLVVKQPNFFQFRNPGAMRIAVEEAVRGGISDCRNRNLQKMFQMIGLGEQAGSGLPKVYRNWRRQHLRPPELWERIEPDHTLFRLRLSSLVPEDALAALRERFGEALASMTETERLALITIEIEGCVTNARLKQMSDLHPRDITDMLRNLVAGGFIEPQGAGRATTYYFPGERPENLGKGYAPSRSMSVMFQEGTILPISESSIPLKELSIPPNGESIPLKESSIHPNGPSIPPNGSSIPPNGPSIPPKEASIPPNGQNMFPHNESRHPGGVIIPQRDISLGEIEKLWTIASAIRENKRSSRKNMIAKIQELCDERFLTTETLAILLGRTVKTIQNKYLYFMDDVLEKRYPNNPRHPQQAYRTRMNDGKR